MQPLALRARAPAARGTVGGSYADGAGDEGSGDGWWHRLHDTGWLRHVRAVLHASVRLVEMLDGEGASVLTHCSDGWDRTPQMCATAELPVAVPTRNTLIVQRKRCVCTATQLRPGFSLSR